MIAEILTAIIDEAARRARPLDQYRIPPPMRSTLGDLPTLETIVKRSNQQWDRVSVNRLAMQPATEIAARCRRCRAVAVEAIPDHLLERAESLSTEIQIAIDRLGCYCVARPSEVTP